jgi:ClpP class serine protease
MIYLLSDEARATMIEARLPHNIAAVAASSLAWEAEALAAEARGAEARDGQLPRGLTIAGSSAEIRVEGVLTKRPDFFAMFFGGGNTTYSSVRNALAVAATDASVKTIVLAIDSPGGAVDGLFETLDAIAALRASSGKTLRVRAENAQSAAYAIAAAAGPIEAVSRGAVFGSIGTVASFVVDPEIVTITNSKSPDKRPDLTTDEGKATVRAYLDQVHDELVRAIARGRDVTAKVVNDTYGRGASFTAPHALELGLIDRVGATRAGSTPLRAVSNSKGNAMAEPNEDARAAASNDAAAVTRGVNQERDRVLAHLTMGESCGDMAIALEAIRSGAGMTLELNARYLSAGMNRSDRGKRQTETASAEGVVNGAGTSPAASTPDLGDQVVERLTATAERSFVRG